MKRRAFIVRSMTSAMSAVVFTATGWLMGTRTLQMTIKPDPEPACCSGARYLCGQYAGPNCINAGSPCPPEGGQGNWGTCVADCYQYCCSNTGQWCYTYCFDVYAFCCWFTDCPTP